MSRLIDSGRLCGQEQEFALGFEGDAGACSGHPGNRAIGDALMEALQKKHIAARGARHAVRPHLFTSNGGSFTFESLEFCQDGGTFESGTPECASARELITYQRAQEVMLLKAADTAGDSLRAQGWPGRIFLLKNCRDASGNVYGSQESYEAEVTSSRFGLWGYRLLMFLIIPFMLIAEMLASFMDHIWEIASMMSKCVNSGPRKSAEKHDSGLQAEGRKGVVDHDRKRKFRCISMCLVPLACVISTLTFRRQRKALESFFLTRLVFSGAGSVLDDDTFVLSEKAEATRWLRRFSFWHEKRAVFESGNFVKAASFTFLWSMLGQHSNARSLFASRQRFQLGFSDANRSQTAEFLKIGVTRLLLDMVDQGSLDDAPRLTRPIEAMHAYNRDPSLAARAELRGGGTMSALELQFWYMQRAEQFLATADRAPSEHHEVVRLWKETLEHLVNRESRQWLVGSVDWLTKKFLLDRAARGGEFWERKKIDLRYHELGGGYHELFEDKQVAPVLTTGEEIAEAMSVPPESKTAQKRGAFIRNHNHNPGARSVEVFWNFAKTSINGKSQVTHFDRD